MQSGKGHVYFTKPFLLKMGFEISGWRVVKFWFCYAGFHCDRDYTPVCDVMDIGSITEFLPDKQLYKLLKTQKYWCQRTKHIKFIISIVFDSIIMSCSLTGSFHTSCN